MNRKDNFGRFSRTVNSNDEITHPVFYSCACVEIAAQAFNGLMCDRWRETGEFFIIFFLFVYPVIGRPYLHPACTLCIKKYHREAILYYIGIVGTAESATAVVVSASKVAIVVMVVVVVV